MRIAIDIDDTITRNPVFFSFLTRSFSNEGHHVVILTHRTDEARARLDLQANGIVYHQLICYRFEEEIPWEKWKGHICTQEQLEILFDDNPEVINHLPEGVQGFLIVLPDRGLVYYD
jgi:hypothetical protein